MAQFKLPAAGPRARRSLRVAVASMAVASLFLLAAGLAGLQFESHQYFVVPEYRRPTGPLKPPPALPSVVLDLIVIIALGLFLFSLISVLRSSEERKRFVSYLGKMLLYLAIIGLVLALYRQQETVAPQEQSEGPPAPALSGGPPPAGEELVTPVAVTPPAPPGWAGYALALLAVLLAALLGLGVWRLARVPQNEIVEIARSAIGDLSAGRAWEDIVVRCYADMSAAVSRRRGLERPQAMTPREFVVRLEQAGLPGDAVRTLTQLFEQARYSPRQSSPADVQRAIDCLSTIVQAAESRR